MAVKCILTGQTPSVLDGVTENVQTQIDAKAADSEVVHKTGNETIAGAKTFTGGVVLKGGADVASSGNAVLNVEGVATDTDYIDMYVSGGTNKTRPLVLQNNSTGNGNVGIGTATPSEKLEVVGNVKATKFKGDGSELTNVPYPVTSVAGKTGEVTLAASDVGLDNVDNTSDADKPISTATQTALSAKQNKLPNSVTLTEHEISLNSPLHGVGSTSFQTLDDDNSFVSVTYSAQEDTYYGFSAPLADSSADGQKPNEIHLVRVHDSSAGYVPDFTTPVSLKNVADPIEDTDAVNQRWAYNNTKELLTQSISVKGILKGDGTGTVTAAEETEVELVELTADSIGAASKEYVDSVATGTTLSVTLASASWTGTAAPYTYTISNSAITTTSTQELSPATDITADQLTALQNANIIDGGQAAGSMTLKAFGEKPSVDIPVRIIVKG